MPHLCKEDVIFFQGVIDFNDFLPKVKHTLSGLLVKSAFLLVFQAMVFIPIHISEF